jgi:hypothetical protein
MPYGTVSQETAIYLRERGLSGSLFEVDGTSYRVDIECFGALDESFDINDMFDYRDVADAIYDVLSLNPELEDLRISVYDSEGEPPELRYSISRPDFFD